MFVSRLLFSSLLLSTSLALTASGQATHESAVAALIADCVGDVAPDGDSLEVSRPANLRSADPAVLGGLRTRYATVVPLPLESQASHFARVSYQLESASVRYTRDKSKHVDRVVRVRVGYTATTPDGTLSGAGICDRSASDSIPRTTAVEFQERPSDLPIDTGPLPGRSIVKRIVGPAVVVAATAVGVYLLFSLRSERQNGSQ